MPGKTTIIVEKSTRDNLRHRGRKSQTYDSLINELTVCDAAGCDAAGTNEIKVSAGKFGTVTLFVCPNCVGKFTE